ncbi:MAG TPA: LysR family transcriptional regulator [Anaerolineaceae bacterium]
MLDIRQMEVFLAAADALNFSKAGEKLGMTQPAVTQQVQALEKHLGLALFTRRGNRLALTQAGLRLIPQARLLLQLSKHTETMMDALRKDAPRTLKIGYTTWSATTILPGYLAEFMDMHPLLQVNCQAVTNEKSLSLLAKGLIDLIFFDHADYPDQEIETVPLFSERLVLIVAANHPWAHFDQISIPELRTSRLILPPAEGNAYQKIFKALSSQGLTPGELNPVLTLDSPEAIAIAVQKGIGAGFIPQSAVEYLASTQNVVVKIQDIDIYHDISIGRSRQQVNDNAAAFWDFCLKSNHTTAGLIKTCPASESIA